LPHMPPLRFNSLQGIVCRPARGLSGSRDLTSPPFPSTKSLFRHDRPPPFSVRVHSLVRPVLYGVCSPASLRRLLVQRSPALGFLPSSRHHRRCLHNAEIPFPRLVPSTDFLNLSTASSTFDFAGFFHPATTSRVSVQGFDPASQPLPTRRRPVPPCPCRARAHRLPGCHTNSIGLRGFLPRIDAFHGVGV